MPATNDELRLRGATGDNQLRLRDAAAALLEHAASATFPACALAGAPRVRVPQSRTGADITSSVAHTVYARLCRQCEAGELSRQPCKCEDEPRGSDSDGVNASAGEGRR